ncbi:hypothetical protein Y032_0385g425 [Ancylostoma ceylanicum]|uniref:Peptidase M13 N-terminal domain-containing protein n=1 Tax=Ancylostoma ceylanicum TaxID=53326 RepID=A0A016RTD0_9BILA|nr:hypothetical protein Y032_0385g425 [Ancylostoma ceylanicum]
MQKAKEMEETLREELNATILGSSWLSEKTKKALILKANKIRLQSSYENIHVKEEQMEAFYKSLDRKEDLKQMTFLAMVDIFVTIAKNAEFKYLNDTTNMLEDFMETIVGRMNLHGAFYLQPFNMLAVTPGFLQFPFYGEKFPR